MKQWIVIMDCHWTDFIFDVDDEIQMMPLPRYREKLMSICIVSFKKKRHYEVYRPRFSPRSYFSRSLIDHSRFAYHSKLALAVKRKKCPPSWLDFCLVIPSREGWVRYLPGQALYLPGQGEKWIPYVPGWGRGITGLPRVREKSGKNKIFSRSGNCQGILKKCQEFWPFDQCQGMSGNFVMTINFFLNMVGIFFACIHFQVLNFLASLNIYSHQTFFKMLYYFYEYCFILLLSGKNI